MMKCINGILVISLFLIACSNGSKSAVTPNTPPTNLTVTATAAVDSSGNVIIVATAKNAVSYDIDFGNGVIQTVTSGTITYKYQTSGNYAINVVAKSSSGQTVSASTNVTVGVKLSLIWSDEFNTDGAPDASKWGYDLGGGGWGNNELEYYTNNPDNVIVQNGVLKITAVKENNSGYAYTSARLLTKGKFSFAYGRIEVKAMLPAGMGPWPAIWMLGNDIDNTAWPACGEMDIMEQHGSELNKIYGTLHYPGHSGANGDGGNITITNATSQFHIYSLDWSPVAIKISVDNQVFHTVANSSSLPFNQNFFVILNMAMGGNFGGTVDPNVTSATMQIDYIRVYQ